MALYALLVGINHYAAREDMRLYGCENDVRLLHHTLQARFALPDTHCCILLNHAATKANIIAGFQQHLAQAQPGDTALFYFSGHGSQEKADPALHVIETDGYNETLVCHDSRTPEQPYDFADKELRYLIQQLSSQGIEVVTLFDSCHSGNVTRETPEGVRQTPGRHAPRPLDTYVFFDQPDAQDWINDFTHMPEGEHIALAACADEELAREQHFGQTKYGVFTYHLAAQLQHAHTTPSYRNLLDAVRQRVTTAIDNNWQTPQLEAVGTEMHRQFLGQALQPVHYQLSHHDGHWQINAGLTAGINRHARLRIEHEQAIQGENADIIIDEALPDSSLVRDDNLPALDPAETYTVAMRDPAMAKLPLALSGDSERVTAVRNLLQVAPYKHFPTESDTGDADYRIHAGFDRYTLLRGKTHIPLDIDPIAYTDDHSLSAHTVLSLAQHMTQWEHAKQLTYALGELPDDLVEVVITAHDAQSGKFVDVPANNQQFDLPYQKNLATGVWYNPKHTLAVRLNPAYADRWNKDIHVMLLLLDPVTGSVFNVFQKAGSNILRFNDYREKDGTKKRKRTEIIFSKKSGTTINATLPECVEKAGFKQITDHLKLFVADFPLQGVDSLIPSPNSLTKLQERLRGGQFRSSDMEDDEPLDESLYQARTHTYGLVIRKPTNDESGNDTRGGLPIASVDSGKDHLRSGDETSDEAPPETNSVEFSVFTKPEHAPGELHTLDLWAHLPDEFEQVMQKSARLGQDTLAGQQTGIEVPTDTRLGASLHFLNAPEFTIHNTHAPIHWLGTATNATFMVEIPENAESKSYPASVQIYCNGIEIARILFGFRVGTQASTETQPCGTVHYPRTAFASYASANREDVLKRIQGIKAIAQHLEIFLDVLSLRAGQQWAHELDKHIKSSDAFYLFWSQAAAASEWVEKEWRLALKEKGLNYIRPVPLEDPRQAKPPEALKALHFNDALLAHIQQAKKP